MRRALIVATVLLLAPLAAAFAADEQASPTPTVIWSEKVDLSPPLRDLAKLVPAPVPQEPREVPMQKLDLSRRANPPALDFDPLVDVPFAPAAPMPAPILSFEGTSDDDNAAVVGFRVVPPDTEGDVGATQYLQWNNLVFEVFNKATGASVLGPIAGNAFFAGFGGVCETTNDGDPTVLWDQLAGRWVVSQFAIDTGTQCVAVSQTADATGAWFRYAFVVTPGGFNDYPKMGIWPDGYYSTYRRFPSATFAIVAAAMERDKMLLGQPAQLVLFTIPAPAGPGCTGTGACWEGVLPSHLEGLNPPPAGSPNYFVMADDDEANSTTPDGTQDFYHVWEFDVDWTTPANSTFTGPVNIPTAEFDINLCNFAECVPQPSPGELLDHLSFFTMWRAVYRNFGSHEAIWVNNSVDLGGDRAGIRWAEIRNPGGTPTLHQAGTHGPADGEHRWMGSLSVDDDGNMALGYSVSSTTVFPSIRYAGRLANDPLGTLPQTETELHAGTGHQTGASRWGDYSAMSLDESDGCTFWYTQEYYAVSGSFDFNTRIGNFKFPTCGSANGTLTGTVTDGTNPIEGATVTAGAFSTTTNASGVYTLTLPPATYDVTASKYGFEPDTVTGIVILAGVTTTQDFALTPLAAVTVSGTVTDGSGAGWPLYAKIDIAGGGPTITVYTDPGTGDYSVQLFENSSYTFTVTALVPGYINQVRAVTTTDVNQTEDFVLTVNGLVCNAPGYVFQGTEVAASDFEAGIPGTWTVQTTTTGCPTGQPGWGTNDLGGRGNLTGGTGLFAIADSDRCGSSVQMDTNLVTNAFDLTTFTGFLQIRFNSDYRDLCSGTNEVKLQVFNGTAWVDVFNFCGQTNRRGPRVETFTTQLANGAANAQVRWRYKANWDWWWEIDNVAVTAGACAFAGGGQVYGFVTDLNTTNPLNGALVTADSGQTVTTVATPADPNVGDGYYLFHVPSGSRTLTATYPPYGPVTANLTVTNGTVQQLDFALPAGQLAAAPTAVRKRVPIGGSDTVALTLNNTGTFDTTFSLLEIDEPVATPVAAKPFVTPALPFDLTTKEGWLASFARTAKNMPRTAAPKGVPIVPLAGESESEFPTGLTLPWGIGFNTTADDMWVGNIAAGGGDDLNYRFLTDGTNTGDTIDTGPFVDVFAADMAFNQRTGKLWQVNVGTDTCLYEMDPVTELATGNSICPAFGTSMRGLAYNPVTDTFYVGTWNGNFIVEVDTDGNILRSATVGLSISGLAYNPSTDHIFVQVNAAPQLVYILKGEDFSITGAFQLVDSNGDPAYLDFEGAGMEMDCDGTLWSVNQTDLKVYANKSGETDACVTDIPWLSETPTSGTIAPSGSAAITFTFDAAGEAPGCQEAQVAVLNDTPYGTLTLPAGITVQFNDVPAGSFADAFIHGIAGNGISYGCGQGNFCPSGGITRATMAIWLLRARYGADYTPPPAVGIFNDVSPESYAADWIEDLFARGITGGCGGGNYCPNSIVTRGQMAVFLLKTLEGPAYVPPACTGVFDDVPCSNIFATWIEDLAARGITAGCGGNNYCPNNTNTRAQMSVFTLRTFSLPVCQQ